MNPILQMLQNPKQQNVLSQIQQIKNLINGKNPDDLYNQLYANNPQFRDFVNNNKGKSPDQIARENGIDPKILK